MMDAALSSLSLASATQASQYSMTIAKKAMDAETLSAQNMLDMLPPVQMRGPQPGDVPTFQKGSVFDVYA